MYKSNLICWSTGNCQCSKGNITITQIQDGVILKNKQEFIVTIRNDCECTQQNVTLYCPGFNSVESINPKLLYTEGSLCIINDNMPMAPNGAITFLYASDYQFNLVLFNSTEKCGSINW